jgi:hypothetical protein
MLIEAVGFTEKEKEEIEDELRKISHYLRPKGIRSDIFSKTGNELTVWN